MDLVCTDLPDGVRRIDLKGRMDIEGANSVEPRFSALVVTGKHFVAVDLSDVEFVASLGLSVLVQAAKAVALRGGGLVLVNPRPNVAKVLTSTRIAERIAVCADMEQARSALRSLGAPLN